MAAGKYRFYTETSLNVRSDLPTGYGEAGALVDRMKTDFANKAIIALINGADQPFGPAGLMALLSLQTAAPDNVANFTGSNSINPWTKLVGGSTINNCQAPKLLF